MTLSCNLTRCLPAPLIVADVLVLKVSVAANQDMACKEGPGADMTGTTGHRVHKYAAVAVQHRFA
jgi:hypothetical protein